MKPQLLVVVKVGGSLLEWPEFPRRLRAWLDFQPAGAYLLVAGGGKLCDVVREADSRFHLGQEMAHWLCIDMLSINAKILARAMGDVFLIDRLADLRQLGEQSHAAKTVCVFDARTFLYCDEPHHSGHTLPRTWDVTTDSIAARLAECLQAEQLVLLKSCDPPAASIDACSTAGYVDRYFIQAARPIPRIACINLRRGNERVELNWSDR
jgi:aspartokinase-like uncharacterized kinase